MQKTAPPVGGAVSWCLVGDSNPGSATAPQWHFVSSASLNVVSGVRRKSLQNSKNPPRQMAVRILGASSGIRTPDTLLKRQVLCLLS